MQCKKGQPLKHALKEDVIADAFPPSPNPNIETHEIAYAIIDPGKIINRYFDLAGRFPQRSSSGNQYIMVGCKYDANSILAEPLKNRSASSLTEAWLKLHKKI